MYEDEGDNYNYKNGSFSEIGFEWDDSEKILTIENRKRKFNGMPEERLFKVILMSDKGANRAKNLIYKGKKRV